MNDVTEDYILNKAIRLWQPKHGYRVAIDPIILAHEVNIIPKQKILDVGSGVGTISLILKYKDPSQNLFAIDIDPLMCKLCEKNARENNLSINLIYNGTHMVTNSDTINLYYDLGVKGAYLSNEITKNEVLNIRSNTKSDLFILLLGNPVVAMSRRSLLTSYFANKNKSKSDLITIKEPKSGQEFLVKEDSNGTTFFYNKRLNLSNVYKELKDSGINYGIIEQGDYNSDEYKELIKDYVSFNKLKIDELAGRNRGFLYRETIYKVKDSVKSFMEN